MGEKQFSCFFLLLHNHNTFQFWGRPWWKVKLYPFAVHMGCHGGLAQQRNPKRPALCEMGSQGYFAAMFK